MKILKFALFSLLFVVISSIIWAQLSQTGNLNGSVTDPEGQALPGVSVTIKSPAIVLPQLSTITNQKGLYRFPSLSPGEYEITFEMDGMNTLIRKGIVIGVGKTSTINVALQFKTLEESITVVGEAPTMDIQKTTVSTILDKNFIASIPSERNLNSYFAMTPGASLESTNWGSAVHGSGTRENAYNLDGVTITDTAIGTLETEFSMDIMEELSIQTGGLAAEYGNVKGAVVNVVTKSGGNEFSGLASFYFNHENLQSDNTQGTALEGAQSGFKYTIEPSIALGGPVVKDKLWFFTNFTYNKKEEYISGFPYDQEEEIPNIATSPLAFAKLTFQPNQKNKFTLSYNYNKFRDEYAYASQFDNISSATFSEEPSHILNFHWTSFFSDRFFTNFKAAYMFYQWSSTPHEPDVPRTIDIATGLGTGVGTKSWIDQPLIQLNLDGTLFIDDLAGSHEFKVGSQYSYAPFDYTIEVTAIHPTGYPGWVNAYAGFPVYGVNIMWPNPKYSMSNIFAYIQDTWSIGKRLTLNLGLRFGHQRGTVLEQLEDEGPITIGDVTFTRSVTEPFTPIKWTTLAPRLGLVYDLTGDSKTLLKASYSRYYLGNIHQTMEFTNPAGYAGTVDLLAPDGSPTGILLGAFFPSSAQTEYGNHKLKSPRTDEVTISLQRELLTDLSVGIRYIKKWDKSLFETVDASQLDIDELMDNGNLVWTNWDPVPVTDPYDGSEQTFWSQKQILQNETYLLNPPGAERDYDGVEVTLTKRYSRGWMLMTSYVWQNSRGLIGTDWDTSWGGEALYNDPNAHENSLGRFRLERRHMFKINGLYVGPWGINISGFFQLMSGQRYTRSINSLDLGVPLSQGSANIYAEERGSRGLPATIILDLRVDKVFRFTNKYSLRIFADIFNTFNNNKATSVQSRSSSPYLTFEEMLTIQHPRILRLGVKFEF